MYNSRRFSRAAGGGTGVDSDSDDDYTGGGSGDLKEKLYPTFPPGPKYQEGLGVWKHRVDEAIPPPKNARDRVLKNQEHVRNLVPTSLATTSRCVKGKKEYPKLPYLYAPQSPFRNRVVERDEIAEPSALDSKERSWWLERQSRLNRDKLLAPLEKKAKKSPSQSPRQLPTLPGSIQRSRSSMDFGSSGVPNTIPDSTAGKELQRRLSKKLSGKYLPALAVLQEEPPLVLSSPSSDFGPAPPLKKRKSKVGIKATKKSMADLAKESRQEQNVTRTYGAAVKRAIDNSSPTKDPYGRPMRTQPTLALPHQPIPGAGSRRAASSMM